MRPGIHSSWGSSVGQRNLAADNCLFDNPKTNVDISGGGFDARGNVITDPRYRSPAAGDYRLGPGSACLDIVGYDTAAKLRGDPAVDPEPEPTATPSATPEPTATPRPVTTPPPAETPPASGLIPTVAETPSAPAVPEATLPPSSQLQAPRTDPGAEPVEAARLVIDDAAFSASGGSGPQSRSCQRKRCRSGR